MDARVDNDITASDNTNDDFLLNEGLDVLALYRSIRNDAVRQAVREMIALVAKTTEDVH